VPSIYRNRTTGAQVIAEPAEVGKLYEGSAAREGDWLVDGVLVRADDFEKYYIEVAT